MLLAVVIGLLMQLIFKRDDVKRVTDIRMFQGSSQEESRSLGQTVQYMAAMIGILVFLDWAPSRDLQGWDFIYRWKYLIVGLCAAILIYALIR